MTQPINWTPEKLLEHTDKVGTCRVWNRTKRKNGYGRIWLTVNGKEKTVSAHRFMMQLKGFDIEGRVVCHLCDNPSCINPDHLLVADHKFNSQDMVRKGRGIAGERHHQAKLTEQQVREIRAAPTGYGTGVKLAKKYGVTTTLISTIRQGHIWRDVNEQVNQNHD